MIGWVSGFELGRSWNGCQSLPRALSVGDDGHLRQQPVAELQTLRGAHYRLDDMRLHDTEHLLESIRGDTLEILACFEPDDAAAFGLRVRGSGSGGQSVEISCRGQVLDVAGTIVPLGSRDAASLLTLHVFLDRSVLEVFVNGGRHCVTKVIYPGQDALGIGLFAEGGSATACSIDIWQMRSAW